MRRNRVSLLVSFLAAFATWALSSPLLAQTSFLEMLHQKPNELAPQADVGFKVAPGFQIETLATDAVTPNARSLTVDPSGQIVVSGPGYIRKLLDLNGDGAIDQWSHFATTKSGASGMVYVGPRLFVLADDALRIYEDQNDDNQADGLPETLFSIQTGPDAARRLRLGPDGALYLLGGPKTDWARLQDKLSAADSLDIENLRGAVIRFLPDGSEFGVYVSGLDTPVDFTFDHNRRLMVLESESPLPNIASWKRPARLTVAQPFTDHGARHGDLGPLFPRHPRSFETPAPFFTFDEGRPIATTFYQSARLPKHFHEGLFVVDWAIGRLVYLPMTSTPGGGYDLEQPNLLFEPVDGSGLTPSDLTVAPDGSLLFTTGDHGTPGGVFRFDLGGDTPSAAPKSELEAALDAPQPLAAWSQRNQKDIVALLGKEPIVEAALREDLPVPQRVRAIELLHRDNALAIDLLQKLAGSAEPQIRAAVAWTLVDHPSPKSNAILYALLFDLDAETRLNALNAWAADPTRISGENAVEALRRLLGDAYLRARFSAAHLAARAPATVWEKLQHSALLKQPDEKIAVYFANLLRAERGEPISNLDESGFQLTREIRDSGRRFQALSLWIRAMGDWDLESPELAVHERPFRIAGPARDSEDASQLSDIEKFARSAIPSGAASLDMELARLAAMRPGTDSLVLAKLVTRARVARSNSERLHYIHAIARLQPVDKSAQRHQLTKAILALNASTPALEVNPNGDPHQWIRETISPLLERNPELAKSLVAQPDFFASPRLELVEALPPALRAQAAQDFSRRLEPSRISNAPHRALARVLSLAPLTETRADLEKLWKFPALRNDIVKTLARNPNPDSVSFFLEGLESGQRETVSASLNALKTLDLENQRPQVLARLIRVLRRSVNWSGENSLHHEILSAISALSREPMNQSGANEFLAINEALQNVEIWFETTYPDHINSIQIDSRDDSVSIRANLAAVDWSEGEMEGGAELFTERNCAQCHARPARFGPELQNHPLIDDPEALMLRVIFPHKEIARGFDARLIQMDTGESFYGFVVKPTDREPLILRTGPNAAQRIPIDRIAFTETAPFSVMPGGLLQGLSAQDVANLHAYMSTL